MINFKSLRYKSYKAQREKWFNPTTCDACLLKAMKTWYEDLEQFEEQYLMEKGMEALKY